MIAEETFAIRKAFQDKADSFTRLSASQQKLKECMQRLELSMADPERFENLSSELIHQRRVEWDEAFAEYMTLTKRFTLLVLAMHGLCSY